METVSYTHEVGERLRHIRLQRGFSLQDVERESHGEWKAAVVGSYERGDRNISASRLCELADFYGVSPIEILPAEDTVVVPERDEALVLDLGRVDDLGSRWAGLRRYCESIQIQRGDFNRRVLSIRGDDLRALAVILDTTPQQLVDELRDLGAVHQN